ncbi:STAS domain-containing protein [Couchioplanes caeruleus]|uniref:STAS domain-containing protein n=1 Tax=Couchioplanes caeruleus TaxID=56438 RepID=UPI0020BD529E|nr:STAS domain-containing protein [Couchioplanes caeruleus]UQU61502.1 STAS domain-containing protein [Couchioplanes caeruleus]
MEISASRDADILRLELHGALDLVTADIVAQRVEQALAEKPAELILDLRYVKFCDSAGIHIMLRARNAAHRQGAGFRIDNVHGIIRRSLEITGVLGVLTAGTDA